jgi:hypothetical protein
MMKRNKNLSPERIAQLRAGPAMHIWEAQIIYPFGKNMLYGFMADGRLPFKKIGKSTLLSTQGLEALVAMNVEAAE